MSDGTIAFNMNPDQLLEFFIRCDILDAKTEQERVAIMMSMAKMNRVNGVITTKRSKAQFVEDYLKRFRVGTWNPETNVLDTYGSEDKDEKPNS